MLLSKSVVLWLALFFLCQEARERSPGQSGSDTQGTGENKSDGGDEALLRLATRDREILDLVVQDLLDPENPEYEPGFITEADGPNKIVMDVRTLTTKDPGHGEQVLASVAKKLELSEELTKSWRRRNSIRSLPTSRIGLRNKAIKFVDLEALYKEDPNLLDLAFGKRFPDAVSWFQPFLPAFTDDGKHAVVVLDSGPSPHGQEWVHYLRREADRWTIVWRVMHIGE